MKRLFTHFICTVALISLFTACSKNDEDNVTPATIGGTYTAYELETYSPAQTIQLPSDGARGEVVITVTSDSLANMQVLLYENNSAVVNEQVNCRIVPDGDGGITLEAVSDGSRAAYLIEDNEVDVYWITGTRISARK